jgi:hypothetical protein
MNPTKNRGELMCTGRENSSGSTSGTRRVTSEMMWRFNNPTNLSKKVTLLHLLKWYRRSITHPGRSFNCSLLKGYERSISKQIS